MSQNNDVKYSNRCSKSDLIYKLNYIENNIEFLNDEQIKDFCDTIENELKKIKKKKIHIDKII